MKNVMNWVSCPRIHVRFVPNFSQYLLARGMLAPHSRQNLAAGMGMASCTRASGVGWGVASVDGTADIEGIAASGGRTFFS